MGNRAKRKQLAELIKKHKLNSKLYRGPKLALYKRMRSMQLDRTISQLQFEKGDLVGDCDGFNHIYDHIISAVWYLGYRSGYKHYIFGVKSFVDSNGYEGCSCGSSPHAPMTVKEIEDGIREYYEVKMLQNLRWSDEKMNIMDSSDAKKYFSVEPICDERGIKL